MMRNKFFAVFTIVILAFTYSESFAQPDKERWTLRECIDYALDNNLNLEREILNTGNIRASLLEAQGQRIPSFSIGAQSGYRWGRSINPFTNLFETQRIGNVNLFGNSNLTLFAGQRINNNILKSKLDLRSNEMDIIARKNLITIDIITFFVNVIFAEEQLKIAERQLETTEEQLDRTIKLVEAGAAPFADQLDLQSQMATNEAEVINADNNLRISKLTLQQAMQKPFEEDFEIAIPELNIEDYMLSESSTDEIYGVAVGIMPEIIGADYRITAAEKDVAIAKGAFYPTLALNANSFSNYVDIALNPAAPQDNYILLDQIKDNVSHTVNLSLNIPIFTNFTNKANLQRALVQKDLERVNMEETKNQLRQNIESSYNDAIAAAKSYEATQKRVAALKESFRMSSERFNLGAINFVDFQLSQTNFFNAEADLINAKYEYILRTKILDFYLGNPLSLE